MNLLKTRVIPTGDTQIVVPVGDMECPMTATITSAAAGRLIELSSNGGLAGSWWSPTVDATTTSMINSVIRAPVSHVRFTGAAGDIVSVR